MSIFAKKQDWDRDQKTADAAPTPAASHAPRSNSGSGNHYGIAEAIQLLRGLPVDQNTELVVRVVRATLASLSVHLSDIIEDATRKQKTVQDKIASEHTKVAELEKQLADHRKEIASLEADLKETTTVKERLQMAEKSASAPTPVRGTSAAVVTTLLGTTKASDEKDARKD
jgi:phage shock protein A